VAEEVYELSTKNNEEINPIFSSYCDEVGK
jgi:hypothetical protein